MLEEIQMSDLNHLMQLAARGKGAGASGGERRAFRLVQCVLADVPGIDGSAMRGLLEWVEAVDQSPGESADVWDHVQHTGG